MNHVQALVVAERDEVAAALLRQHAYFADRDAEDVCVSWL